MVIPLALLKVTASLAAKVSVPKLVILWAVVPLKVNVLGVAGLKTNDCPAATEIFPLILIPPVRFKLSEPFVTVKLSILNGAPPVDGEE